MNKLLTFSNGEKSIIRGDAKTRITGYSTVNLKKNTTTDVKLAKEDDITGQEADNLLHLSKKDLKKALT